MKKFHIPSAEKWLLLATFSGVLMGLSYWHQQSSLSQLSGLNIAQNGVHTCHARLLQTFTAVMIKDLKSNFLSREFMGTTDQCLTQVERQDKNNILTNRPEDSLLRKYKMEGFWYHEKITKVLAPMFAKPDAEYNVQSIASKFDKLEDLKINILESIEKNQRIIEKTITRNERIFNWAAIFFMMSLVALVVRELRFGRKRVQLEKSALNLLNLGEGHAFDKINNLLQESLHLNEMPILAQVMRDFYRPNQLFQNLEKGQNTVAEAPTVVAKKEDDSTTVVSQKSEIQNVLNDWLTLNPSKKIHQKLASVDLNCDRDFLEQLFFNSINYFESKNSRQSVKLEIFGQEVSNNYHLTITAPDLTLGVADLNYFTNNIVQGTNVSLYLVILKELCAEQSIGFELKNVKNNYGKIIASEITFIIPTSLPLEENPKRLKRLVKGKKRHLREELRS